MRPRAPPKLQELNNWIFEAFGSSGRAIMYPYLFGAENIHISSNSC